MLIHNSTLKIFINDKIMTNLFDHAFSKLYNTLS